MKAHRYRSYRNLNLSSTRGFTIVELVIVVIVIGVLAGIVTVAYRGATASAQEAALKSDLKAASAELTRQLTYSNAYPDTAEGLPGSNETVYVYSKKKADQFCLSATWQGAANGKTFHITHEDMVREGECPVPIPDTQVAKLFEGTAVNWGEYGKAVAIAGDSIMVSAIARNSSAGAVDILKRNGDAWTQYQALAADDGDPSDLFGSSIATNGDVTVIGAINDDDLGTNAGAAYVFVRSGDTWVQQAKLLASDGATNDNFGSTVAISGETVVIGAPGNKGFGYGTGAAYVFARSGDAWAQQAKLLPSSGASGVYFGRSVAILGDTVVVGGPHDTPFGTSSGSADVFVRTGSSWSHQVKLVAPDGARNDQFGGSVLIQEGLIVVGSSYDDDTTENSGSVHLFARNGSAWPYQHKLVAGDPAQGDRFGATMSASGSALLIGAPSKDSGMGAAYIFIHSDDSWSQRAKLMADIRTAWDSFGSALALDGDVAVVGANLNDELDLNAGAVYVFRDMR